MCVDLWMRFKKTEIDSSIPLEKSRLNDAVQIIQTGFSYVQKR